MGKRNNKGGRDRSRENNKGVGEIIRGRNI